MCSEPWELDLLMMMNQGTPEETPGLCCVLKMLSMLLRCVEQFMSSEMFFFTFLSSIVVCFTIRCSVKLFAHCPMFMLCFLEISP